MLVGFFQRPETAGKGGRFRGISGLTTEIREKGPGFVPGPGDARKLRRGALAVAKEHGLADHELDEVRRPPGGGLDLRQRALALPQGVGRKKRRQHHGGHEADEEQGLGTEGEGTEASEHGEPPTHGQEARAVGMFNARRPATAACSRRRGPGIRYGSPDNRPRRACL